MATFFIRTGSDPAAVALYDVLKSSGFDVYDEIIAETGSLLVFNAQKKKLSRVMKDARTDGLLEEPFSIRVVEIREKGVKPMFRKSSEEVMQQRFGFD